MYLRRVKDDMLLIGKGKAEKVYHKYRLKKTPFQVESSGLKAMLSLQNSWRCTLRPTISDNNCNQSYLAQ
jgi:hypothetical protein